jgi:hypothetical protein
VQFGLGLPKRQGTIAGVIDRFVLRPGPGNLDAVARYPERFQEVRIKIRVADTATACRIPPNEAVEVATDKLHVFVELSLEVREGGGLVREYDVVGLG